MQHSSVDKIADVIYRRIDDEGLHIPAGHEDRLIGSDSSIVLCAGQLSVNAQAEDVEAEDRPVHVVGGASFTGELDA